jgi:hypothetical protein
MVKQPRPCRDARHRRAARRLADSRSHSGHCCTVDLLGLTAASRLSRWPSDWSTAAGGEARALQHVTTDAGGRSRHPDKCCGHQCLCRATSWGDTPRSCLPYVCRGPARPIRALSLVMAQSGRNQVAAPLAVGQRTPSIALENAVSTARPATGAPSSTPFLPRSRGGHRV